MSKFQVGDRIEFIEEFFEVDVGTQGTIISTAYGEDEPGDFGVDVAVDGGNRSVWVYDKRLAPAQVEQEAVPVPKEFRFFRRSDAAISNDPYETFEAALAGWKVFAQDGNEVEIIEIVSHGTYKAVLKIEEA